LIDAGASEFQYSDGSTIEIAELNEPGRLQLIAMSLVDGEKFSHLNSYCVLHVTGHSRLSIAFSPCRDTEIDVLPADYPSGRPARFAYVDAANRFYVAEANAGEKGPFRLLASGTLQLGEPITVFFRDNGVPMASVVIEDWSSQLGAALGCQELGVDAGFDGADFVPVGV
jgi:hypothetical protein